MHFHKQRDFSAYARELDMRRTNAQSLRAQPFFGKPNIEFSCAAASAQHGMEF
jgi:hypothetical protein